MTGYVVKEADSVWAVVQAVGSSIPSTVVRNMRTAEEIHESVEEVNIVADRRSTSFVSGVRDRVDGFRKRRRPVGVSTHRPTGR